MMVDFMVDHGMVASVHQNCQQLLVQSPARPSARPSARHSARLASLMLRNILMLFNPCSVTSNPCSVALESSCYWWVGMGCISRTSQEDEEENGNEDPGLRGRCSPWSCRAPWSHHPLRSCEPVGNQPVVVYYNLK